MTVLFVCFHYYRYYSYPNREELIEKYAKLTDAATYRERKAMWQVERHRLDAKRFEYLQREDGRLTEELQQRPLVPISGAGDAVDSSQV